MNNFSIFSRFAWHSYRKSLKANANKLLRQILPQANTIVLTMFCVKYVKRISNHGLLYHSTNVF